MGAVQYNARERFVDQLRRSQREGLKEGLERGREEGLEEGREQGLEEGRELGASRMLVAGLEGRFALHTSGKTLFNAPRTCLSRA